MEQHVIAVELSATGAQELLAATSSAHLVYTAEDGTPRAIPVSYFLDGRVVRDLDCHDLAEGRALKARPDVALPVDGGDTPEQARALSVRGRASVEIVDGMVPENLAAARKSMGAEAAWLSTPARPRRDAHGRRDQGTGTEASGPSARLKTVGFARDFPAYPVPPQTQGDELSQPPRRGGASGATKCSGRPQRCG
jgi:hypothetical protein